MFKIFEMQNIQPYIFTHQVSSWHPSQFRQFYHLIDASWAHFPSTGIELQKVIDLLKEQEEELLSIPDGKEILSTYPARPDDPLFYFLREQWLEEYNEVVFSSYLHDLDCEILALDACSLTRIPRSIGCLKKLKTLSIINIPIRKLPPEFGDLACLKNLVIYKTHLRYLCPEFSKLQALERVELRDNQLVEIEPLGSLQNLQHLSVLNNYIQQLPRQIEWSLLEIINLSNNQIEELPEAFYNLRRLSIICAQRNQLSHISSEIGNFTKLDSIFLDDNKIVDFPLGLCRLGKLRSISLKNNQLTNLPIELNDMSALTEILFKGNPLQRPSFLRQDVWSDQ